jgi:hypothetical protein
VLLSVPPPSSLGRETGPRWVVEGEIDMDGAGRPFRTMGRSKTEGLRVGEVSLVPVIASEHCPGQVRHHASLEIPRDRGAG